MISWPRQFCRIGRGKKTNRSIWTLPIVVTKGLIDRFFCPTLLRIFSSYISRSKSNFHSCPIYAIEKNTMLCIYNEQTWKHTWYNHDCMFGNHSSNPEPHVLFLFAVNVFLMWERFMENYHFWFLDSGVCSILLSSSQQEPRTPQSVILDFSPSTFMTYCFLLFHITYSIRFIQKLCW